MSYHRDCYENCGGTDCPGMVTYTATAKDVCEHKNGWYVTVDFWIFSKRVFVCSDCGEHFKRSNAELTHPESKF